jgi:hypothetical protein
MERHIYLTRSRGAVDRNGSKKFRKDFVVKGAKRRLRRSKTLDNKILSKHTDCRCDRRLSLIEQDHFRPAGNLLEKI